VFRLSLASERPLNTVHSRILTYIPPFGYCSSMNSGYRLIKLIGELRGLDAEAILVKYLCGGRPLRCGLVNLLCSPRSLSP
jgi:hypothetical protein